MTRVAVPEDIAKRAKDFVGRGWVLDEVVNWMDLGEERFFLITGEPGVGKTALGAWLAGAEAPVRDADAGSSLHRAREAWRAAHFCVRGNGGTLNPIGFAQSLAEQFSDRYDHYAEAAIQQLAPQVNIRQTAREVWGQMIGAKINTLIVQQADAEDVYDSAVRQPLEKLFERQPGLRIFVMVDGLDEALAFDRTNIVTLLAGSGDLPEGVRFLLTSRNEPRVIGPLGQARRLDLSSRTLADKARADIRAYVEHRMAQEAIRAHMESVKSPEKIKDALVERAANNFLYTEFLLDEVADGMRSLENLKGLPRGLYGLYFQFLSRLMPEMLRLNTSQRWVEQFQPLLGSLSVATPAAPQDALPRWLGRSAGEVAGLLNDVVQVTEYDPNDGGGYRLYHASMAEFLASGRYQENGEPTPNLYYTPTREQHERIIRYYLTEFGDVEDGWEDCDPYGLRQLVGHMRASLTLAETPRERRRLARAMHAVVLDEKFREAQREKLGDIHTTLSDLRTALDVALERDDLVKALECVGVYRDTIRSQSITEAIFGAIRQGDFERALRQSSHYEISTKPRGNWEQVLLLYLAWEAAEQHNTEAVKKVMASADHLPPVWGNELRDALMARTARTLASMPGEVRDARSWLTQWGPGPDAYSLLAEYESARPLDPAALRETLANLNHELGDFRRLTEEGNPEAISVAPLLEEEEWVGDKSGRLRILLMKLAPTQEGQARIDEVLDLVLPNLYPRYRDIGLVALGVACLLVPDPSWVRPRFQSILRTALEQEGVTFAFDLPAVLLEEARKRRIPARQLSDNLSGALGSNDRWGTGIRAHSARAAALFRQGKTDEAFGALSEAGRRRSGFAGYGVLTLLSLANRCYEFGHPECADEPKWGSHQDTSLLDGAEELARNVREQGFREERLKLVEDYRGWAMASAPDADTVLATLAETPDPDTRRAYKDHVSARWASPSSPDREGLKRLVPTALADATTLDAVLGRLCGLGLGQLSDDDLAAAIGLCAAHFLIDRPDQWFGRGGPTEG
jgi:hypothetical protein